MMMMMMMMTTTMMTTMMKDNFAKNWLQSSMFEYEIFQMMSTATIANSAFLHAVWQTFLHLIIQQSILSCGATFRSMSCHHPELTKPIQQCTKTIPNNMLHLVLTSVAVQLQQCRGINGGNGGHLENDILKW
jgi:hypothetical protein